VNRLEIIFLEYKGLMVLHCDAPQNGSYILSILLILLTMYVLNFGIFASYFLLFIRSLTELYIMLRT